MNQQHQTDDGPTPPMKITLQDFGSGKERVSLDLEVNVLGQKETIQRNIEKANFENYSVDFRFGESLSLDEFVNLFEIQFDEQGKANGIQIDLTRSDSVNAVIDQRELQSSSSGTREKTRNLLKIGKENQDEPSVPAPPTGKEIEGKENQRFYKRMVKDDDSQPSIIREIIYEAQTLTREELNDKVEEAGYSRSSSGIPTTLRVLEKLGEIEREDDGETQKIRWTDREKDK